MLRLAFSIPISYALAAGLALLFPAWPSARKRAALAISAGWAFFASLALGKIAISGELPLPMKAGLPWLEDWLLRSGPLFYLDGLTIAVLVLLCGLHLAGALHALSRSDKAQSLPPHAAALSMALLSAAALSSSLPWTIAFLCAADACAFVSERPSYAKFIGLLLPCLPAALAAFVI
ncbi:MAG TPA: hypothetical protein PLL10_05010, partial [Elusimicrobiales bacterium]|nr:hypothetical protein [Elusimicrobiales bacterium]